MTCIHGSDPMPKPLPFANDAELMAFLGLPDTEKGRAACAALTDDQRTEYATLRAVCEELKAGRIPRGVIACNRVGRTVR
jgi:hypothetical protein